MAGETILVVDDSPVNLKLAAAVLRSDGYRVQLASNAEQALMMLRSALPALMLVDIQLPGMNGLELTRQLRQDPRTRDIVIIALTAAVATSDQHRAFEAGCDGFIGKPIDTRTLGERLRAFLDGAASDAPAGVREGALPAGLSLSGPEMEGLRRSFLTEGTRQVRRMLEFVNSRFDTDSACRLFHQWIGAAGALGYMDIADLARTAENLASTPGWSTIALHQALTALAAAFAAPREAADTPIPESIAAELARKRFALIGFPDEEAERVCEALGKVGALPRLFAADDPPSAEALRDCSVLMVHVRPETAAVPWLKPGAPASQPLVLVGGREALLALPPSVQARACEFLIDGWQPEEVVMRLSFALSRNAPRALGAAVAESGSAATAGHSAVTTAPKGKMEVLIADDDIHVLAVIQGALQSLGMDCRTALNGPDALRLVREHRPHAAVLDVNMPGMDGFEVLAGIRQDEMPIKIIMLTARQHERDVLRGFELGADDYVVKPFNPLELAARLKRLL
jgi:CheY-like chemotaxis protein